MTCLFDAQTLTRLSCSIMKLLDGLPGLEKKTTEELKNDFTINELRIRCKKNHKNTSKTKTKTKKLSFASEEFLHIINKLKCLNSLSKDSLDKAKEKLPNIFIKELSLDRNEFISFVKKTLEYEKRIP